MKQYVIVLDGKPFGKQRHRNSGSHRTYTPKKTVDYETSLALEWIAKYKGVPIEAKGFKVNIYCCFLPPKSANKATKKAMLCGEILYTKKPDYDNVAKIVGDGLNGIAWYDDSSIVIGNIIQVYRPYECVKLVVTPITEIREDMLEFIDGIGEKR